MSQRSQSPITKSNKPIAKTHFGWKRVNKLAHRLSSKGVPASIVAIVDSNPKLTPAFIRSIQIDEKMGLREMSALAKLQSIQVLQLRRKYQKLIQLKRKQTEMTQAGSQKQSNSYIKQNMGQIETYDSVRPQQAEAVFI